MLDRLRRRLFAATAFVLVLLVSALLALSLASSVATQREDACTTCQRMAFLLIYQLEGDITDAPQVLADYEREMGIASRLVCQNGDVLYSSDAVDVAALEEKLDRTMSVTPLKNSEADAASGQGGIVSVADNNGRYSLIPATVLAHDGQRYRLTLAAPETGVWTFLAPELPQVLLLWCIACAVIALTTHLLLRRAFAPAEAMIDRQKAFVAAASHELKSPLAVIVANTDLLAEEPLSLEGHQRLTVVEDECNRLARLTGDLLLLTSADAGRSNIVRQPVDLEALLIDLYDAYAPLCTSHGQHLALELPEASLPTLSSDPSRLRQILTILLNNATSHTPPGTDIRLIASANAKGLTLSVSDNGPGIAPKDQPHIFERFYRADSAHSDKRHTGLGLSIAQVLTSQLNGHLSVSDTPGGGATFRLTLPL